MKKQLKTNGFSQGLNFQQVITYFLMVAKIILFQFVIVCNFLLPVQVILSIFYYFSTFLVIIYGFRTTVIDPTDDVVQMERKARINGDPFDSDRYELHCEVCQTSVSNNTKHCRTCDRCVDEFDHHCEWVNNCISRKNYRSFAMLIASVGVSLFMWSLSGMLFLVDYYTQKLHLIKELNMLKRNSNGEWETIVVLVFVVACTCLFILDMRLIVFHIYISTQKMTTYDYIIKNREKQREKKSKRRSSLRIKRGQAPSLDAPSQHGNDLEKTKDSNLSIPQKDHNNKHTANKLSISKLLNDKMAYQEVELVPEVKLQLTPPKALFMGKPGLYIDKGEQSTHLAFSFEEQKHMKSAIDYDLELQNKFSPKGHKSDQEALLSPKSFDGSPFSPLSGSPSNGNIICSYRSSIQELVPDDMKRDDHERGSSLGDKIDGMSDRFMAVSLAKIAHNYGPKYGKILEEENESERPTLSENVYSAASGPF